MRREGWRLPRRVVDKPNILVDATGRARPRRRARIANWCSSAGSRRARDSTCSATRSIGSCAAGVTRAARDVSRQARRASAACRARTTCARAPRAGRSTGRSSATSIATAAMALSQGAATASRCCRRASTTCRTRCSSASAPRIPVRRRIDVGGIPEMIRAARSRARALRARRPSRLPSGWKPRSATACRPVAPNVNAARHDRRLARVARAHRRRARAQPSRAPRLTRDARDDLHHASQPA